MFAVHSSVLPQGNFRHAFNWPIHFDEWYSKFLGHGQLEKHPSSLLWCSSFTVHLWLEGGHPKEKVGYLHINVSALVTFQLCFTLGIFLSVFVNTIFLLNYLVPLIGKCQTSISLD